MELQGLGLINITFNHWLKKYGFTSRVRGVDEDFFWYHNNTISYSFFFPTEAAENWALLMEELGCKYDLDVFYTAFFHELGHGHTYWDFEEDELDEYYDTLTLMDKEPSSFADSIHYVYTHLPVEYEASRWAVHYINTHPERVKELVDLVGKAVRLFYKINKVVTEDMF